MDVKRIVGVSFAMILSLFPVTFQFWTVGSYGLPDCSFYGACEEALLFAVEIFDL